jgi:hypothetical protein
MQDSFNLGWKLAAVLRGLAAPELLRTYSDERRAVAQELIEFDRELSAMFSAPLKDSTDLDSDGIDPADLQRYLTQHLRFTAGTGDPLPQLDHLCPSNLAAPSHGSAYRPAGGASCSAVTARRWSPARRCSRTAKRCPAPSRPHHARRSLSSAGPHSNRGGDADRQLKRDGRDDFLTAPRECVLPPARYNRRAVKKRYGGTRPKGNLAALATFL